MELVTTFLESPVLLQRTPVTILRTARCLLEQEELWCQGALARDGYPRGRSVKPNHPRACCWSAAGAIAVCSNPLGIAPPFLLQLLDGIVREWGLVHCLWPDANQERPCPPGTPEIWESADDFNDQRPHRFILALLDEAASRLRAQGMQ